MDDATTARRKWWVAALLSLLMPGLGQLYNGQQVKAAVLYLAPYAVLTTCLMLIIRMTTFLVYGAIIAVVLTLYIIIDAALTAWRIGNNYELKKYNKTAVYLAIYIVFGIALENAYSYSVKHFLVQAYKIPAASMEPALLVGDHILIDKFSGNSKSPDRGDIAVFVYQEDPRKDFIKRVVGLPGDTVEFRGKQLYINGEFYAEDYVVHRDNIVMASEEGPRDNFGPVKVPEGSYFTLGDNRDRSFDSRYWGFVSQDKIHGVARVIYWSWDTNDFEVRWDRIGTAVR